MYIARIMFNYLFITGRIMIRINLKLNYMKNLTKFMIAF